MMKKSLLRTSSLRRLTAPVALVTAGLLATGCTITPTPLAEDENVTRVRRDLAVLLAPQEPLAKPVSMHEAMARAIKYNLDERVKLMEMAVATQQLDLSRYDMLPQLVAGAGYTGRNNEAFSRSLSFRDRTVTDELAATTAVERHRRTADLGFTWNVLDFGLSYVRARQNANLVLIADERRRRVVQGILQDVRTAYWRAVAAERLLTRLEPLERRIEAARRDAGQMEAQRARAPLEALTYQRSLVDTLRQLQAIRRDLIAAKSQLGALMGLPPGEPFAIEIPPETAQQAVPALNTPVDALETFALLNRPELLEESYNQRITADETWRALLRLLPGLNLNAGLHYDSNSFLINQRWADWGARVSWNLIGLATAPASMDFARAQEELVAYRRQALSMAVLSQVRVAMLQYRETLQEYTLSASQDDIDERIRRQYVNIGQAGQQGELDVIQAEVSATLSRLRRDLVYADLQNAYARVMVSAGVDPLPEVVPSTDVGTLSQSIARSLSTWQERANTTLRVRALAAEGKAEAKPASAATVPAATAPAAKVEEPQAPVARREEPVAEDETPVSSLLSRLFGRQAAAS